MPSQDIYILPSEPGWNLDAAGETRFNWDYEDGREKLLALYQKGKDKQWDAEKRIDWDLEVDPYDALGLPDETIAIYVARILQHPQNLVLLNNKHPMVPESTLRAGYRLVLHGLASEMLYELLVREKRKLAA